MKTIECPSSVYGFVTEKHISLDFPSSLLVSSLLSSKRIWYQTPGFAICKRRTTTALNQPTPSVVALFIFNHKKSLVSSICLKRAKVSLCPYSPCSHFTTKATGELPSQSNHRQWERFHTTLDILRQRQAQAQSTSCTCMKGQDFILPFCGENILYGTLYKGLSHSRLFYDLLQPALLSSCQFLSAAANNGHNLLLQSLVKVIWKTCFKTEIKLINFLMRGFLCPKRHLLAEPVVFSMCWG